jgi:hypothetical protein
MHRAGMNMERGSGGEGISDLSGGDLAFVAGSVPYLEARAGPGRSKASQPTLN